MARTPLGHFRRINASSVLASPDSSGNRSSLYGYINNYRTRQGLVGDVNGGAVPDPVAGAAPLAVDGDASAIAVLGFTGRGSFPATAPGLLMVEGTAYARESGVAVAAPVKVSRFDWKDSDVDDVPFGTVAASAHTYAVADTYAVEISNFDALQRPTRQAPVDVVVS